MELTACFWKAFAANRGAVMFLQRLAQAPLSCLFWQLLCSCQAFQHGPALLLQPTWDMNAGVAQFCETAKRLGVHPPVSIQNDFSPFLRTFEGDLAEACAPRNYNIG
eukprot:GHRR01029207.1.p1 GENE.GHRR01029207.1~~GHRR01029207.1.p1  ORF type:complete len:107 (+),score=20.67 GHRR01029207.1:356-676(+)